MFFIIILLLYYYFFVAFEKAVPKPQSIAGKYVDLNDNLYEKDSIVGKINDPFDYDKQATMKPFDYSIQFNNPVLSFKTNENEWNVELTPDYYWEQNKILEKDDCFGKGNSKVLATGKNLYKHILQQDLQSATSNYNFSDINQNLNIFYFTCKDNHIHGINACPPGSIFEQGDCILLETCTDKSDGFKYSDPTNVQKYFECRGNKSISKKCNQDEFFQYDQCLKPKDICIFKPDGFKLKTGHKTYIVCEGGKAISKTCFPNTYFLDTKCEAEICYNKYNELVPAPKMTVWPFSFHQDYIKCGNGKFEYSKSCPILWDYQETEVDITHLPQVFDGQQCAPPKLCENVQLEDPNAVVPAYKYSKEMANWHRSKLFDSLWGFKCSPTLEEVKVPSGSIIKNYKIENGCNKLVTKVPTKWWNQYFDCATKTSVTCPKDEFFDGMVCRKHVENAFRFKQLDVFKFNNLHVNNWFKPREEIANQSLVTCERGDEYIHSLNICAHPDCKPYTFIKSLKRPIKLNDEYECVWDEPNIKKMRYDKPQDLTLKFWEQRFVPKDHLLIDECKTGHRVSTGNIVLDKTLYMTCRAEQPFIFCPSSDTLKIHKITEDYLACMPQDKVYRYNLPPDTSIRFVTNEILKIEIPANAHYLHNGQDTQTRVKLDYVPDSKIKEFDFRCNLKTIVHFKTLVNNPPDTYIKDKQIHKITHPKYVYNIRDDNSTVKNLNFDSFDLEYSIDGLKY